MPFQQLQQLQSKHYGTAFFLFYAPVLLLTTEGVDL